MMPLLSASFQTAGSFAGVTLIAVFIFSVHTMARARRVPPIAPEVVSERRSKKGVIAKLVAGMFVGVPTARFTVWSASNIEISLGVPRICSSSITLYSQFNHSGGDPFLLAIMLLLWRFLMKGGIPK